jgi:mono/diheme cytochrome c family protein
VIRSRLRINGPFLIVLPALTLATMIGSAGGCGYLVDSPESPALDATNQSVSTSPQSLTEPSMVPPRLLERGHYIVEGPAHCFGCHSEVDVGEGGAAEPSLDKKGAGRIWTEQRFPLLPEQEALTGEHQWIGFQLRQQVLVSPNITPDQDTGAGKWSDETLARAIREGVGQDGRILSPVMPSAQFRSMSDEDLRSVIAYLRSMPSRHNPLPAMLLPAEVRAKLRPPDPIREPVPPPDFSDPVKRGAYLVGMSNCRGCHSSFDGNFQALPDLEFAGGSLFKGSWGEVNAPNITPASSGISHYNVERFIEVMRTGSAGKRSLNPVMPWHFFGNMTDEDLEAIFAFLQTLKPIDHLVDNTVSPTICKQCGGRHGKGKWNN